MADFWNWSKPAQTEVTARNAELLAALLTLRKACDAVRPFSQSIAAHTVHGALDVKAFMEAIGTADAAIAKARGEAA